MFCHRGDHSTTDFAILPVLLGACDNGPLAEYKAEDHKADKHDAPGMNGNRRWASRCPGEDVEKQPTLPSGPN